MLNEELVKINKSDIDLIFSPLKPILESLSKLTGYIGQDNVDKSIKDLMSQLSKTLLRNSGPIDIIDSSKLTSPHCRKAHAINPIKIYVYSNGGYVYLPSKNAIRIGFSNQSLEALSFSDELSVDLQRQLKSEFTPLRIQSTIVHELTHWIDDSLNNLHMSKVSKNNPSTFSDYLKSNNPDINLGHIEINAVVNQIAQIKKQVGKSKWNVMTWKDLIDLHPSLNNLNNSTHSKEWRKRVFQRLARENLIGNNMKI